MIFKILKKYKVKTRNIQTKIKKKKIFQCKVTILKMIFKIMNKFYELN